jgi:hypothetical protein
MQSPHKGTSIQERFFLLASGSPLGSLPEATCAGDRESEGHGEETVLTADRVDSLNYAESGAQAVPAQTNAGRVAVAQPIPMTMILLVAFVIHAPLLMMKLPLKSYDTNFHIFFASHYVNHWFDPWNTKWYAGFSQTTYPPLPQQWLAIVSHVTGLDMAYMVVQFVAILCCWP